MPSLLEIPRPEVEGKLKRLHLVGLFALWSERTHEPDGSVGAVLEIGPQRIYLTRGLHYSDPLDPRPLLRTNGDGTSLETVGSLEWEGDRYRVDVLSVDVPEDAPEGSAWFRDLGTPASFVVFEALYEFAAQPMCPFRGHAGHVSLAEVGAVVRVGDRSKFGLVLAQLSRGLEQAEEVDEARSLALTFIAVVSAAVLERGGSREVHQVQLQAARAFERLSSSDAIFRESEDILRKVVPGLMQPKDEAGNALIDRALQAIDRYYAKPINDATLAERLGLSTSHFRHLFREATGQPFHRYLIAVRLEQAREMLQQQELSVAEVAQKVGFASPAHFTRAFTKRFSAPPSSFRPARR